MDIAVFFILATVCLGAVLGALLFRNQAYTALFVVLALSALAGLYGLLDAPFIAVVQIIIYAGAIMVLFIFVLMMIHFPQGIPAERKKVTLGVAVLLGLALGLEIFLSLTGALKAALPSSGRESFGNPAAVGRMLLTNGLYAFELTSVLLLAALVGALILARKRGSS
jgi:NADH-quinone oxidoreductase subunit J